MSDDYYAGMDAYDKEYIHSLLKSGADASYNWKKRLFVNPIHEQTRSQYKRTELIVNTSTGHISIIDNNHQIKSATKDIEAELYMQKFWVTKLNEMLNTTYTYFHPFVQTYKSEHDKSDGYFKTLHDLENLMLSTEKLLFALNEQVSNQSLFLFKYYKKALEFIPVFLARYYSIFDVIRQIEELEYMRPIVTDMVNRTLQEITSLSSFYNSVQSKVNTKISKQEYLKWCDDMENYWNNNLNKYNYKGHYIYGWKNTRLHINRPNVPAPYETGGSTPNLPNPSGMTS